MSRFATMCDYCKRHDDTRYRYCEAYPDGNGIPEAVEGAGHFKPKPGDHGLQFEPKNGVSLEDVRRLYYGEGGESYDEDREYGELSRYIKEQDMTDEEWAAHCAEELRKNGASEDEIKLLLSNLPKRPQPIIC